MSRELQSSDIRPVAPDGLSCDDSKVWILVPARKGSKSIPNKCLRVLGNKPLILHVVDEVQQVVSTRQIVVSTDSPEIVSLTGDMTLVHHRPPELADDRATLDEVAVAVADWLMALGARPVDFLLTIQPTCPFIKSSTVEKCCAALAGGARSVVTVRDDRHLRWTLDENGNPRPLFDKRVNRQWLPPTLVETGGVIGARIGDIVDKKVRIQDPIALIEVDEKEGLDIDKFEDLALAEYLVNRKRIAVRVDGSSTAGIGQLNRAIVLAREMAEHDVRLVTRLFEGNDFGSRYLERQRILTISEDTEFLSFLESFKPDIVIMDVLDTDEKFMREVRTHTKFVVTFEDFGPGARCADLVINDLYTDSIPGENHWYGINYAILAPGFEAVSPKELRKQVEQILIIFGGRESESLCQKTLSALEETGFAGEVLVVLSRGSVAPSEIPARYPFKLKIVSSVNNMPMIMREADIAITSAGRTVTELMSVGVPTMVLCQNSTELRHTHASSAFGVMNLGFGQAIGVFVLADYLSLLINDCSLRRQMRSLGLNAIRQRSNKLIAKRILAETARTSEHTAP